MPRIRVHGKGVRRAARSLHHLSDTLEIKAQKVCQNLAIVAIREAQMRYGNWDVAIDSRPLIGQIGVRVSAKGTKPVYAHDGTEVGNVILFAEFGTGLLAGSHPWSTYVPGVYPGSYSERYGTGEYAATGMWHWAGRIFVYGYPTYAMYFAAEKTESSIPAKVKEVFR